MRRALVVAACAATVLTGAPAHAVSGGSPAADGTYRFAAQIEAGGVSCSGVLVAPQWVATAATCFPSGLPSEPATATVGRTDLAGTGGHVVAITGLYPRWDRNFALAKLATAITDIPPIAVATTPPAAGDVLRVAGYGRTATEWVPDRLHTATFTVQAVKDTTLDIAGTDASTCKGDSGGPAFREAGGTVELVALNSSSWQRGCYGETETRNGAVETRLDGLTDWFVTVQSGGPGAAVAKSTDLALTTGSTVADAPATAVVGQPAAVTLAPESWDRDVAGYLVSVGADAAVPVAAGADGKAVVPVVPVAAGSVNQLTVQVKRKDGSAGPATTYKFKANAAGVPKSAASDLTGDGRSEVVYAKDVGGAATVWSAATKHDGSGSFAPVQVFESTAYRTATTRFVDGDVDGDGRDEVIAVRDRGQGRIDVSVLASTGNRLSAKPVTWDSQSGGWDLAGLQLSAADVTGDGKDDLVIARPAADGSWQVQVIAGASAAPVLWHTQPAGTSTWARTRVHTGDVTGDGKDDLVRVQDNGSRQVKVWVQASTGTGLAAPAQWFDSGRDTWDLDDVTVVVGDFAGQAQDDVAVLHRNTVNVLASDGTKLTGGQWWSSEAFDPARARIVAGDFAGNAKADLGVLYDQGYGKTKLSVLASSGTAFGDPALRWESGVEWSSIAAGTSRPVTDLAADATFTASSSAPDSWGWSLRHINDDNRDSTVTAGWSSWSNVENDHTEWVELTFPGQRHFNRVDLYPRNDAANPGTNFPANFTVDVWTGAAWVPVVSKQGYANPGRSMASFSFPTQWTNKIRVQGTALKLMQFAEVEVYLTAPVTVSMNLAPAASAAASSSAPENWGWALRYVNDGNRGMPGWSSWSNVDTDHTEWLEFTWPAQRHFNRLDLYPRSDGASTGTDFPRDFTIEAWNGSAWVVVLRKTGHPAPTSGAVQSFTFPTQHTTKMRLVGTSVRIMAFAEAEVYLSH